MQSKKLSMVLATALGLGVIGFVGCGGGSSPSVAVLGVPTFQTDPDISLSAGETVVMTVRAVDPDGNAVTYTLSGTDAGLFDLDASTGDLTFKSPAAEGVYTVVITANDGSQTKTQTVTVTVEVAAINNPPVITTSDTVGVDENQFSAVDVDATDADGDTISYAILVGGDGAAFTIDSNSGAVSFNVAPDFETKATYALTVEASDGASVVAQNITININDVGEGTAPVIIGGNSRSVSVDENQFSAVDVDATDVDGDTITYSIEAGGDGSSFDINSTSGVVTFKTAPDYETQSRYLMTVGASAAADKTLQDIEVNINDLNGASNVLKTGQTHRYEVGDDGDYQEGVERSFTDNGSTITDNVAGLQWIDNSSQIPLKSYSDRKVWIVTIPGAATYCNQLNEYGHDDWRLPSVYDLYTLTDRGSHNPAIFDEFDNTLNTGYWSITQNKRAIKHRYAMNFYDGTDYSSATTDSITKRVRCVRTTRWFAFFLPRFTRVNNIVNDSFTKLQWQDNLMMIPRPFPQMPLFVLPVETWKNAIKACEISTLGGYSDWRLPNVNELLSIADKSKSTGTAIPIAFKHTNAGSYFSSTTSDKDSLRAWMVNFANGEDAVNGSNSLKTSNRNYRCVRTVGD